ncbi:hypothetical protein H2509_08630 [Stappia sp. F7233]|uniref:Uncharacterized protein n=1 Tax=Stappia albiluteola TaxID=2758565 RepID=A0A839ABV9_9HYPH|nr:hypothetical protein [Stappia albiluteola]
MVDADSGREGNCVAACPPLFVLLQLLDNRVDKLTDSLAVLAARLGLPQERY